MEYVKGHRFWFVSDDCPERPLRIKVVSGKPRFPSFKATWALDDHGNGSYIDLEEVTEDRLFEKKEDAEEYQARLHKQRNDKEWSRVDHRPGIAALREAAEASGVNYSFEIDYHANLDDGILFFKVYDENGVTDFSIPLTCNEEDALDRLWHLKHCFSDSLWGMPKTGRVKILRIESPVEDPERG